MPTFVDLGNFPNDWQGVSSEGVVTQTMREIVQEARKWLLIALDQLADMRIVQRPTVWAKGRNPFDLLGEQDTVVTSLAFEVLESAYINSVNAVFLFDPEKICGQSTTAYVKSWDEVLYKDNAIDSHGRRIVNICPPFLESQGQAINASGHQKGDAFTSRAATLVHELTHLPVAKTDDISHEACSGGESNICYGLSDSLALAKANPDVAQRSADNYAYFVERLVLDYNARTSLSE